MLERIDVHVGGHVGIPHVVNEALRLAGAGDAGQNAAGEALVAVALTVLVDAQHRCAGKRAHRQTEVAAHGSTWANFHGGTGPQAHLLALATPALAGKLLLSRVGLGDFLAKRGEHVLVARAITGGQDNAELGGVLVELTVTILANDAGNAVGRIADEAVAAHAVHHSAAGVNDCLALSSHGLVDAHAEAGGGRVGAEVAHLVLPAGGCRPRLGHGLGVLGTHGHEVIEGLAAEHGEVVDKLAVGAVGAVKLPVVHELGDIVLGHALVELPLGVDVTDGLAKNHEGVDVVVLLLKHDDALAQLGGMTGAGGTGVAAAHDNNVGFAFILKLGGHLGRLAQPGGVLLENGGDGAVCGLRLLGDSGAGGYGACGGEGCAGDEDAAGKRLFCHAHYMLLTYEEPCRQPVAGLPAMTGQTLGRLSAQIFTSCP